MPIFFSASDASAVDERVLWVDDYVSRADSGLLTPTTASLGFKTYIPSRAKAVINLDPIEYLAAFRNQLARPVHGHHPRAPSDPRGPSGQEAQPPVVGEGLLGMAESVDKPAPSISAIGADTEPASSDRRQSTTTTTTIARKSAPLHQNLMTKLRPVPFQYIWTVYYDKSIPPSSSSPSPLTTTTTTATTTNTNDTKTSPSAATTTYTDRLTILAPSIPDIAEFYKVFNNISWSAIRSRDTVHIFRSGVKPLWEDPENIEGGCWTLKVRRQPQPQQQQQQQQQQYQQQQQQQEQQAKNEDRPRRVWEEITLMGCGGELQAALVEGGSRDHVLGMSFSPRLYWVHISVWLKKGTDGDGHGVGDGHGGGKAVVQRTVLERLSPELRPRSESEYYYRKHSDHDGWEEAVRVGRK